MAGSINKALPKEQLFYRRGKGPHAASRGRDAAALVMDRRDSLSGKDADL
jgi:hypothetical protein